MKLSISQSNIISDIEYLSEIVDTSKPGYTRLPFTEYYLKSRNWLKKQMEKINLETRIDSASNLIGLRKGLNPELPPIVIGSHTDSVIGGGKFDGILGVVAGLEIVRTLNKNNITLQHNLLIVDFTAEEAGEYGLSTIGSRGMIGELTEEILSRKNSNNLMLKDGIKMMGGNPDNIWSDAIGLGDYTLYLELHIEQGPVLDDKGYDLGVVTGIAGIERYQVNITGQANHAGTTPMNMRKDALCTASEIILEIEKITNETNYTNTDSIVGTVGKISSTPNFSNVVPGSVELEFEIRSINQEMLNKNLSDIKHSVKKIANSRDVDIKFTRLSGSTSVRVGENVQAYISESCNSLGKTLSLPSGAGHDGNHMAKVAPVGMIFVPSKDGKSHCPEEWTDYDQITVGVKALFKSLIKLDGHYFDEYKNK